MVSGTERETSLWLVGQRLWDKRSHKKVGLIGSTEIVVVVVVPHSFFLSPPLNLPQMDGTHINASPCMRNTRVAVYSWTHHECRKRKSEEVNHAGCC